MKPLFGIASGNGQHAINVFAVATGFVIEIKDVDGKQQSFHLHRDEALSLGRDLVSEVLK